MKKTRWNWWRLLWFLFLLLMGIGLARAQNITMKQLVPLSNYVLQVDTKDTFGSNYLWNLIQMKGDVTTAQLLFCSNYLWGLSGMGGGTNVTLAQLLQTSNDLRTLSFVIDANMTNYVNSRAVANSNLSYAIGTAGTNYTLTTSNSLWQLINTTVGTNLVNTSNGLYAIIIQTSNSIAASYIEKTNGFGRDTTLANLTVTNGMTNVSFSPSGGGANAFVTVTKGGNESDGLTTTNVTGVTFSGAFVPRLSAWQWMDFAGIASFGMNSYDGVSELFYPVFSFTNANYLSGDATTDSFRFWKVVGFEANTANTIMRLDNLRNVAAVTVGEGMAFDGTTLRRTNKFGSLVVTNGIARIQTNMAASDFVVQVDYATGPSAYYWNKISGNMTLQFTNVWPAGISNRVIDFYINGSDNGNNYTVTFSCPNPVGVSFKWGVNSIVTAGSITVTNAKAIGVSITGWQSNLFEGYYSHIQ